MLEAAFFFQYAQADNIEVAGRRRRLNLPPPKALRTSLLDRCRWSKLLLGRLKPAWLRCILGAVAPLLDGENRTMRAARLVAPVVVLALVAGCGTSSTPETTKPAP